MVHMIAHTSPCTFLFGAGASAPARLPTSFGLTEKFIDCVKDQDDEELSHALCLVLGAMHMLRGQKGQFPEKNLNVEEVAETLDTLCFRQEHLLSPFVGSWHEMLSRFDGNRSANGRNYIRELSDLLKSGLKEWLQTPQIGRIRYFQFLRGVVQVFNVVDIFTLNYDLCVETALTECGENYTCGFNSNGWDAAEFGRIEMGVRLYKLHGSLDWYRDTEDQIVYSIRNPPEDRVPAENYEPLVIFGGGNKMKSVDPFLHLSYTFSERVKLSNVIAVVGYGFGDGYINDILAQGFSIDTRKRMVVVGRTRESSETTCRERFGLASTLIDAGRVAFVEGGAEVALSERTLLEAVQEAIAEATTVGPF